MLRACWRLSRCAVQIGIAVFKCTLQFPFLTPSQRMRHTGRWCAQTARALGLRVHTSGPVQAGPLLLAANHVSWLDILAINSLCPARFVSKADVHAWPVLGRVVAGGGTLFIERERKRDALRVVHQIAQALKIGDTVAMFPEGTTSDGRALLPFHANLLQAAIVTETPVQPVVLRYSDTRSPFSDAVVWLGDTTLVGSLWKVVCAEGLQAQVTLLAPVASRGRERRELADVLHRQIAGALTGARPSSSS